MGIKKLYNYFLQSSGVSTDTRTLGQGQVFLALSGPNFNGNMYADEAIEKGALIAIVDDPKYVKSPEKYILVKDCLKMLQRLATYHREQIGITIIALTGSNGKTTSKELIKSVLSAEYALSATEGNLNNHIGVPLTILKLNKAHKFGIIEMGANHLGEIALLCKIAKPDVGIITNIGKAHLEGFGSEKNIKKAKGELYDYLIAHNKKAFVNANLTYLLQMAKGINDVITYGYSSQSDYYGEPLLVNGFAGISINHNEKIHSIKSNLVGQYNCENILLAIAIGLFYAIPINNIKQSIENYTPTNKRSQLINWNTNQVVLDSYNANPTSMRAAIDSFLKMEWPQKVVILGAMLELGNTSTKEHKDLVKYLISSPVSTIILVGEEFKNAATNHQVLWFRDTSDLKTWLKEHPIKNSQILVKGSRGIGLEIIIE